MRKVQNPNIILQFNTDKELVKEWIGGASHISKELGYTKECILSRCNHTIKKMSMYKNCFWIYKDEFYNDDFSWENYLNNKLLIDIKKKKEKIVRKISQYTLDRVLVKIWDSLSDVRSEFGNTSQVSAILHHRNGKKTAYGYIWAFEDYDFLDGYFDTLNHYYNKANENRKKKIAKINPENYATVCVYNSLTDAMRCNKNINSVSNITVAAKGFPNHKCDGFLWKYVE